MVGMDKAQLDELRRRLEQDRDSLRAEIEQNDAENVRVGADAATNQYDPEFSGYGTHMAETGTEIYEQERNLAIDNSMQHQLDGIERALTKFDAGSYGICDNCGQPIAPERLQAFPQAALCITCASKLQGRTR